MKTPLYPILLASLLLLGTMFISCQSAAKKEEVAQEKLQDAKQDLKEVQQEVKEEEAETKAQTKASAEEWEVFKKETELKIAANEIRIAELKIQIKKSGKTFDALYAQKIELLENKNKKLRTEITSYESSQTDWEAFKRQFNSDLDELREALNEVNIGVKK